MSKYACNNCDVTNPCILIFKDVNEENEPKCCPYGNGAEWFEYNDYNGNLDIRSKTGEKHEQTKN